MLDSISPLAQSISGMSLAQNASLGSVALRWDSDVWIYQLLSVMRRRILDYVDCPFASVYALPPSCSVLQTLADEWSKLPNIVAALEISHAVLADQDDYDIALYIIYLTYQVNCIPLSYAKQQLSIFLFHITLPIRL